MSRGRRGKARLARLGRRLTPIAMPPPTVQILTPLFNEEKSFDAFVEAVDRVLISDPDIEFRCLLIDDGSTDRTWELIQQQCAAQVRVNGQGVETASQFLLPAVPGCTSLEGPNQFEDSRSKHDIAQEFTLHGPTTQFSGRAGW